MWFRIVSLFTLAAATASAIQTDIKLERPDAQVVLFASEHNGWKPLPMTKNESGVWHIELELEPGEYGYKFIVDDNWLFDPKNDEEIIVDGTPNSKLTVSASAPKPESEGEIESPTEAPANLPETEVRDWKDSISGKTIQARLVGIRGRTVVLQIEDQRYPIRIERLRPSDQEYIESMRAAFSAGTSEAAPDEEKENSEESSPEAADEKAQD